MPGERVDPGPHSARGMAFRRGAGTRRTGSWSASWAPVSGEQSLEVVERERRSDDRVGGDAGAERERDQHGGELQPELPAALPASHVATVTAPMSSGDSYEISDDPARLDRDAAWAYLSTEAYWGRSRSRADFEHQVDIAWRVLAAYAADGSMVGFCPRALRRRRARLSSPTSMSSPSTTATGSASGSSRR